MEQFLGVEYFVEIKNPDATSENKSYHEINSTISLDKTKFRMKNSKTVPTTSECVRVYCNKKKVKGLKKSSIKWNQETDEILEFKLGNKCMLTSGVRASDDTIIAEDYDDEATLTEATLKARSAKDANNVEDSGKSFMARNGSNMESVIGGAFHPNINGSFFRASTPAADRRNHARPWYNLLDPHKSLDLQEQSSLNSLKLTKAGFRSRDISAGGKKSGIVMESFTDDISGDGDSEEKEPPTNGDGGKSNENNEDTQMITCLFSDLSTTLTEAETSAKGIVEDDPNSSPESRLNSFVNCYDALVESHAEILNCTANLSQSERQDILLSQTVEFLNQFQQVRNMAGSVLQRYQHRLNASKNQTTTSDSTKEETEDPKNQDGFSTALSETEQTRTTNSSTASTSKTSTTRIKRQNICGYNTLPVNLQKAAMNFCSQNKILQIKPVTCEVGTDPIREETIKKNLVVLGEKGPVDLAHAAPSFDEKVREETIAKVQELVHIGFTQEKAKHALKEKHGNTNAAADWLYTNADTLPDQHLLENPGERSLNSTFQLEKEVKNGQYETYWRRT